MTNLKIIITIVEIIVSGNLKKTVQWDVYVI